MRWQHWQPLRYGKVRLLNTVKSLLSGIFKPVVDFYVRKLNFGIVVPYKLFTSIRSNKPYFCRKWHDDESLNFKGLYGCN